MKIQNYINGKFEDPINGEYIDNYNPSIGEIYGQIPNSNKEDVEKAYQAAAKAFPNWSNTTLEERSKILSKIADLILEKLDFLAAAESKDNGKPISLAKAVDIPRAASNFQFFANAITQFSSESHESIGLNAVNFTLRQPLGVVGCISPWNLPLYLFTWKIAPAIAVGNCVVAKPSEITPMTAFLLGEICNEAGLPKGVLNIVHGLGTSTGQAIVSHPNIKAISFTGGTKTGAHIAKIAAPMFKKLSLELGGKNPCIIDETANIELAAKRIVWGKCINGGQTCIAPDYLLIHKSVKEKFVICFKEEIEKAYGKKPQKSDDYPRIVNEKNIERLAKMLENETILLGGKIDKKDNYISPTLVDEPSSRKYERILPAPSSSK